MNYKTIVSADELEKHLDDPGWVVFDCRFTLSNPDAGQQAYNEGHIPGSRYVHLDNDLSSPITAISGRHPLPDPVMLAGKLGAWGVDAGKQVVVYDDTFGAMAVRMWWVLRWLGHENVALLDGVYPKWVREKRPVTIELPEIVATTFEARPDDSTWVTAAQVQQGMAAGAVLLDARAEERFEGLVEPLDKVAGHVPGAINRPFEDNLEINGVFLSPEDLKGEYAAQLGDAPVIHMCGSGVTACHNILAMVHAGLNPGKLYAGSWSEWITDKSRPVVTE